jgi:NTP pyrophosphatase (non-canonical NTP hydrolase)
MTNSPDIAAMREACAQLLGDCIEQQFGVAVPASWSDTMIDELQALSAQRETGGSQRQIIAYAECDARSCGDPTCPYTHQPTYADQPTPAADGELVPGSVWKEPEDDCWTSEVQALGGYEVVATVHGATEAQAMIRRDLVLAALQSSPAASTGGGREAIARLLCEQQGGDPDAVAVEEHDSWDGPLWTVFLKDADAILKLTPSHSGETGEVSIADVWQQAEENHRLYSATGGREEDIRFLTLGLTGEAGEVANFVKKRWRDGDGHDEAIRLEIADVCAYAFMLANTMGMTPADLMATIAHKQQVFIAKMKSRTSPDDGGLS